MFVCECSFRLVLPRRPSFVSVVFVFSAWLSTVTPLSPILLSVEDKRWCKHFDVICHLALVENVTQLRSSLLQKTMFIVKETCSIVHVLFKLSGIRNSRHDSHVIC